MKFVKRRLKAFPLMVLPVVAGCSGEAGYSVSGGKSDAQALVQQIHPIIKPFLIALATLAIGYNALIIILGPASAPSGEDAVAVAKRRLILVISGIIAYGLLFYLLTGDII